MDKVIFLDRDGTINKEDGYITRVDQLHLYEGAVPALKLLNSMGYRIVVVSNQAGVAKALLTEQALREINSALLSMLKAQGVLIDALYYCPHHPDAVVPEYKKVCECRKPNTGMIRRAELELQVTARSAYMIGDKLTDIELAVNFGGKGILLMTGYGSVEIKKLDPHKHKPVYIAQDILDAVQWIQHNNP